MKRAHVQNKFLYCYLIRILVTIYVDISGLTIYLFICICGISHLTKVNIYEQSFSENKEIVLNINFTNNI